MGEKVRTKTKIGASIARWTTGEIVRGIHAEEIPAFYEKTPYALFLEVSKDITDEQIIRAVEITGLFITVITPMALRTALRLASAESLDEDFTLTEGEKMCLNHRVTVDEVRRTMRMRLCEQEVRHLRSVFVQQGGV